MGKEISIVFPAKNQGPRLLEAIPEYQNYFKDRAEYIIIDNGTNDGTEDEIRKLADADSSIVLYRSEEALGKGGAVYKGFELANTDVLAIADPDGAAKPEELQKIIDSLTNSDLSIGSRYLPDSIVNPKQPLSRRMYSRLFNVFVETLFRLHISDTQCGFKAIKKDAYEKMKNDLKIMGFAFDVELLDTARKHSLTITQVPIVWAAQEGSTVSFMSGVKAGIALFRYRIGR